MKNKFLYKTRKTYHKVRKLNMTNSIKSEGSIFYDKRLLKMRKLIIKWFNKNSNTIIMLDINPQPIIGTLEYGRNNYLGCLNYIDRKHIYNLIEDFNTMCEEIEDFYG